MRTLTMESDARSRELSPRRPACQRGFLAPGVDRERGSQTLEFTLIGLPITFLLFSIANMCFGMMTLHTIQEAVEQTARIVSTRGSTCSSGTNTCTMTVEQIADAIATLSPGVSPNSLKVALIPAADTGNTITCSNLNTCQTACSGGSCNTNRTTAWPTSTNSDNSPGKDIIITADIAIPTPIMMFWTGSTSGNVSSSTFHAYSRQRLMF